MFIFKAVAAVALLTASPASALWPIPREVSTGDGVLFIDSSVEVTYNGESVS